MTDFWHSVSSNLPTRGRVLFSALLGYSLTHITMECVGQPVLLFRLLTFSFTRTLSSVCSETLKETFVTEVIPACNSLFQTMVLPPLCFSVGDREFSRRPEVTFHSAIMSANHLTSPESPHLKWYTPVISQAAQVLPCLHGGHFWS